MLREDTLPAAGLTPAEAAKRLDVAESLLRDVLDERAPVTADLALRLARVFGGDPEAWLDLQRNHDLGAAGAALGERLTELQAVEAARPPAGTRYWSPPASARRGQARVSAYVSIFDDWQLLDAALSSIAPLVDEIVVVDGAYEWLAPHLAKGRDPARPDARVRDALAPFARKVRVVEGVWRDEAHKRAAGFEAARGRWVLRADADEVLFPNAEWERFLGSGKGVGLTVMPTHAAPGWIMVHRDNPTPRNAILFDTRLVSAAQHLSHLWLVGAEGLPPPEKTIIHPEAIAHTAHLNAWRPPETAVNRARFYVLNTARAHDDRPRLEENLLNHTIVNELDSFGDIVLLPSPLAEQDEARLAPLYAAYMRGLAELNATLLDGRAIPGGDSQIIIDITDDRPLVHDGKVRLAFSRPVRTLTARVRHVRTEAPWAEGADAACAWAGDVVEITLPEARPWLRRTLRLWVTGEPMTMRALPGGARGPG